MVIIREEWLKQLFKTFHQKKWSIMDSTFFMDHTTQQVARKLEKTGCKFKLFKGDTQDTLPKAVKTLPKMDLIFIDGGKSYTEAKSDWEYATTLMHNETAAFIHNYYFWRTLWYNRY